MASDALSILTPSVVTKIVSRVRTPGNVLSRFFGFEIGGSNVQKVPGRTYTYDLFDNVRSVARGRAPGVPAGSVAANPIGNVQLTLARSAEKLALDYELVNQIRSLGQDAGTRDRMGARYIERQSKVLRMRQDNLREFVTAGAIFNGGKYGFYLNGDDLLPTFDTSGTYISVDHQIPAGNILRGGAFAAGLQMGTGANIIDASWATASTDIPLHLEKISDAFMAQVGQPLSIIFVDNQTKLYILQNDKVRQLAGTSNQPFADYTKLETKNPDGTDAGVYRFTIKGAPQYTFFSYGGQLDLVTGAATNAPTATKLLQDSYATFMIEPDSSWFQMVEGSEIVKDNDLAPPVEREGFYSWILEKADPARFELHTLQNLGLELNVPKGVALARVR
jgi:hypothetical protein